MFLVSLKRTMVVLYCYWTQQQLNSSATTKHFRARVTYHRVKSRESSKTALNVYGSRYYFCCKVVSHAQILIQALYFIMDLLYLHIINVDRGNNGGKPEIIWES